MFGRKSRTRRVFVANLPTIRGLGQFGGFDLFLQDRGGHGHEALTNAAQDRCSAKRPSIADTQPTCAPNALEDAPQLDMTVDRVQAQTMGLSLSDVYRRSS